VSPLFPTGAGHALSTSVASLRKDAISHSVILPQTTSRVAQDTHEQQLQGLMRAGCRHPRPQAPKVPSTPAPAYRLPYDASIFSCGDERTSPALPVHGGAHLRCGPLENPWPDVTHWGLGVSLRDGDKGRCEHARARQDRDHAVRPLPLFCSY
jgi:hypothetical protein